MTATTRCYITDSPYTDEEGNKFSGHAKVLRDGERMRVPMTMRDGATVSPVRIVDWRGVQRAAGQVTRLTVPHHKKTKPHDSAFTMPTAPAWKMRGAVTTSP